MGMAAAEPQFHVLAVDDSLIDRKIIERLLKTSSYQVTTVDSGNKALEFLGLQYHQPSISPHNHHQVQVQVNLIITDYCMPGMTGYDLLKKLKESSLFRNIPVVIMSSENVPSRITRCLEEGAEEFFLKPVRLSDVTRLRPHMLRAFPVQKHHKPDLKQRPQSQQIGSSEEDQNMVPRKPDLNLEQQSNNKRKSMEEGLSPERTRRPRYSGLTIVI